MQYSGFKCTINHPWKLPSSGYMSSSLANEVLKLSSHIFPANQRQKQQVKFNFPLISSAHSNISHILQCPSFAPSIRICLPVRALSQCPQHSAVQFSWVFDLKIAITSTFSSTNLSPSRRLHTSDCNVNMSRLMSITLTDARKAKKVACIINDM